MALNQNDLHRSIQLLSDFCRATEDAAQRRAYTQAISILHTYLKDILPAYQSVHGGVAASAGEHVVEIDCSGVSGGQGGVSLNTLTTAQYSPIVISALKPSLSAVKNRSLRRGDQVIAINNHSLAKASIERAR